MPCGCWYTKTQQQITLGLPGASCVIPLYCPHIPGTAMLPVHDDEWHQGRLAVVAWVHSSWNPVPHVMRLTLTGSLVLEDSP